MESCNQASRGVVVRNLCDWIPAKPERSAGPARPIQSTIQRVHGRL